MVPYLLGQTANAAWSFAIDASAYGNQEQLHDVAKQKGYYDSHFHTQYRSRAKSSRTLNIWVVKLLPAAAPHHPRQCLLSSRRA